MLRFIGIFILIPGMAWASIAADGKNNAFAKVRNCTEERLGHTVFMPHEVETRITSREQIVTIYPVMARCIQQRDGNLDWEQVNLDERIQQMVEVDGKSLWVQEDVRDIVAVAPSNRLAVTQLNPGDKNTAIDVRFTDLITQSIRDQLVKKEIVQVPIDLSIRNLVSVHELGQSNINYQYYNFSDSLRIWIEIHRDDLNVNHIN